MPCAIYFLDIVTLLVFLNFANALAKLHIRRMKNRETDGVAEIFMVTSLVSRWNLPMRWQICLLKRRRCWKTQPGSIVFVCEFQKKNFGAFNFANALAKLHIHEATKRKWRRCRVFETASPMVYANAQILPKRWQNCLALLMTKTPFLPGAIQGRNPITFLSLSFFEN